LAIKLSNSILQKVETVIDVKVWMLILNDQILHQIVEKTNGLAKMQEMLGRRCEHAEL
jgi:hypothetical protein